LRPVWEGFFKAPMMTVERSTKRARGRLIVRPPFASTRSSACGRRPLNGKSLS
jgi:hypothetical protein